MVLDWEVPEGEVNALAALVGSHPSSTAARWPSDRANSDLADSFVGIERFLATNLVAAAATARPDAGITTTVGTPPRYELQPQKKTAAKKLLLQTCEERDDASDLQPLVNLLPWLEGHIPAPGSQLPIPAV